jgi:hypothetical protein
MTRKHEARGRGSGPAQRTMTRKQQIDEAHKLLNPPADKADQCCEHIREWLHYVEFARQAAGITRKENSEYSAALAKLCSISRTRKGQRLIGQELLERAVAIDKKTSSPSWAANIMGDSVPPPPLESRRSAAIGAYELLRCWGHKLTTTAGNEWHKLAAILFGQRDINLHRHILKVHSDIALGVIRVMG